MARLQFHDQMRVQDLSEPQLNALSALLSAPAAAPRPSTPLRPFTLSSSSSAASTLSAPSSSSDLLPRDPPPVSADPLPNLVLEEDLKRARRADIAHHRTVGTLKGRQHAMGLPVRGQRNRTNGKTAKRLNRIERRTYSTDAPTEPASPPHTSHLPTLLPSGLSSMCFSSSTLFYGLTVRALPLCLVARAYPRIKPALLALDLIRARRDAGTLETHPGQGDTDVGKVPGELWDVVKEHVVEQCYADEVDAYVRDYDNPECDCPRCCRRPTRITSARYKRPHYNPRRFNLDDLWACGGRMELFLEGGGVSEIVQNILGSLDPVLCDFGLCVPDVELISTAEYAFKKYPAPAVEILHEPGPVHIFTRISPSAFILPPDANRRFHRLLTTFPMLDPTTYATDTICPPSEHVDEADERGVRTESAGRREIRLKEERKRAQVPGWMLWGQGSTCR
ncbi:hypothetical protein JCM10450v2_001303 [Rhodotorula kratochvilovae]